MLMLTVASLSLRKVAFGGKAPGRGRGQPVWDSNFYFPDLHFHPSVFSKRTLLVNFSLVSGTFVRRSELSVPSAPRGSRGSANAATCCLIAPKTNQTYFRLSCTPQSRHQ